MFIIDHITKLIFGFFLTSSQAQRKAAQWFVLSLGPVFRPRWTEWMNGLQMHHGWSSARNSKQLSQGAVVLSDVRCPFFAQLCAKLSQAAVHSKWTKTPLCSIYNGPKTLFVSGTADKEAAHTQTHTLSQWNKCQ